MYSTSLLTSLTCTKMKRQKLNLSKTSSLLLSLLNGFLYKILQIKNFTCLFRHNGLPVFKKFKHFLNHQMSLDERVFRFYKLYKLFYCKLCKILIKLINDLNSCSIIDLTVLKFNSIDHRTRLEFYTKTAVFERIQFLINQ